MRCSFRGLVCIPVKSPSVRARRPSALARTALVRDLLGGEITPALVPPGIQHSGGRETVRRGAEKAAKILQRKRCRANQSSAGLLRGGPFLRCGVGLGSGQWVGDIVRAFCHGSRSALGSLVIATDSRMPVKSMSSGECRIWPTMTGWILSGFSSRRRPQSFGSASSQSRAWRRRRPRFMPGNFASGSIRRLCCRTHWAEDEAIGRARGGYAAGRRAGQRSPGLGALPPRAPRWVRSRSRIGPRARPHRLDWPPPETFCSASRSTISFRKSSRARSVSRSMSILIAIG